MIVSLLISLAFGFVPNGFRANIEQIYQSVNSTQKKTKPGKIEYQNPGRLRLQFDDPQEPLLVCNEKTFWHFRPALFDDENAEVTITEGGKHQVARLFDILKSGLGKNSNYLVKELSADKSLVTFVPSIAKELGIKKAEIVFGGNPKAFDLIKSIQLEYSNGKKVEFVFKKIEVNPQFSANYFTFEIPPKTNVIRN